MFLPPVSVGYGQFKFHIGSALKHAMHEGEEKHENERIQREKKHRRVAVLKENQVRTKSMK